MRKLSCSPNAEVLGALTSIFLENLLGEDTAPIFRKHGVFDMNPETWYPLQPVLDAFNELSEHPNLALNMVAIGIKFVEAAPSPPDNKQPSFETLLKGWDEGYQMHHRGADVGRIWVEKVNATHFKVFYTIVYPDDFSYGVLYGFAKRFLPEGSKFTVFYDPDVPARDYNGTADHTIIHIQW